MRSSPGRLFAELGLERVAFVGFSWGARVGCSFAAQFPELTASLTLIDGGYVDSADVGADLTADLATCVAEARDEIEEDSFASWDAYFAFERESLGRWTPALEAAHRATMREVDGRVVPILEPEALGAIKHGGRREPVTETYAPIAAAGVPVLLVTAVARARCPGGCGDGGRALSEGASRSPGRVDAGRVHDLVSCAPLEVVALVGPFAAAADVTQASASIYRRDN